MVTGLKMHTNHSVHIRSFALVILSVCIYSPQAQAGCEELTDEINRLQSSVINAAFDVDLASQSVQLIEEYRANLGISNYKSELFANSKQKATLMSQRKSQQRTKLDQKRAEYEEDCE
jgi:hypothetical protein